MFKVLLINPPYLFNASAAKVTHLAMEKKPSLNVLYLATYLKMHTDFEVKIIDAELEKMIEEQIRRVVVDFNPDVVGISVVSFKIYPVYRLLKIIKSISEKIHICLGGPHLKIYPKETLDFSEVDSIVIGDGEIPFFKICHNLSVGESVNDIEGVYTRNNLPIDGVFKKFETHDLNILPIPDLALLDYKKYRSFLTDEPLATSVTSRGCPYNCIFCQLDQKVRLRSIDHVLQEIESYLKLGVKEIEFYDETFNISTQRVIEFADKIIERGWKFRWSFRGRVNMVSEEMLVKIKKAGCQRIQYGVEAGSDKTLNTIKKGINTAMIKSCFELTRRAGIETVAYFMIGNPGETRQDILDTINFAKKIKADYVNFAVFLLVPGVEVYRDALNKKIILQDYWLDYVKNPQEKLPMVFWEEIISREELFKLRGLAIRKFYFRFNYIFYALKRINLKNLRGYWKGFYSMLFDILNG